MSSWVPTAPLSRENVPLWSSVHREGELPPVATQGLEKQLCLVLWPRNSREFSGSHRMARGAAATTLGDIARPCRSRNLRQDPREHHPYGATPSVHPALGRLEIPCKDQWKPLPGLGFWGHPPQGAQRRVRQARPEQRGVPGRARGDTTIPLHFPGGLGQPGQEQGRHPCVPRLAKKKSSAVAGDLWWLMQGVINSYSSTRRVKRGATHWVELGRGRRGDNPSHPWPRRARCPRLGHHHLGK